jgi:hypothetical protein
MDESLKMFLFGFAGSVAIEVFQVVRIYESGRRMPARYRRFWFWLARGLLAATGGLLAVAYKVQSEILAFNIGASAPAILATLARTPPGEETGPSRPAAASGAVEGSAARPMKGE